MSEYDLRRSSAGTRWVLRLLAISATSLPAWSGGSAQSVAARPPILARCTGCHSVAPGQSATLGPSLVGVVGRKAGAVTGFHYSSAMQASGIVWTRANLDRFIAQPSKFVQGTRMAFPGIQDAKQRQAIIAYLAGSGRK